MDTESINLTVYKKVKTTSYLRRLRLSLKYRPDIFKIILKLRQCVRRKNKLISNLKKDLDKAKKGDNVKKDDYKKSENDNKDGQEQINVPWGPDVGDVSEKSIADQVKEVAQNAVDQTGMVYVESAGMYYDYKTGYYYSSELGLYYHPDTGCYYYYSDEKNTFVFHSYPDTSKITKEQKACEQYKRKLAKKHKKDKEEDDGNSELKTKRKKLNKKRTIKENDTQVVIQKIVKSALIASEDKNIVANNGNGVQDQHIKNDDIKNVNKNSDEQLEDGECSESESSHDSFDDTTPTASDDDDFVAKHHPPCMRVIVKETNLPKLKVGTLFLVTKDGGTIGREGEHHTIILNDQNVSRNHMDLKYDATKKSYVATDIGSKNGTILNGRRMCESQEVSSPMLIQHGSVIQLGETKLLCHIHPGTDTCGHCEPGLIMEESEKKQVAYTRTCSIQKQHQLELARLKNKYVPEPLAIEETSYQDRAQARRDEVGSSHDAEKTHQTNLDTSIADDNKGFQLLKKMGWSKGEGLGKDKQGELEPIALVNNESKAGLGAPGSKSAVSLPIAGRVPLRLPTRTRKLRPPANAFRDPLEEDDDDT